jgi:hypothetical protein
MTEITRLVATYKDAPEDRKADIVKSGRVVIVHMTMWGMTLNERKFSSIKRAREFLSACGWHEVKKS